MKYVVAEPRDGGYWHDPRAYLAALPGLAASLPSGARVFATDPERYDFYGTRCVKDLVFGSLETDSGGRGVTLRFEPNHSKHVAGLVVTYQDVVSAECSAEAGDSVRLDEILPDPAGVSHEFKLLEGLIRIVAADLTHTWA